MLPNFTRSLALSIQAIDRNRDRGERRDNGGDRGDLKKPSQPATISPNTRPTGIITQRIMLAGAKCVSSLHKRGLKYGGLAVSLLAPVIPRSKILM